MNRNAPQQKTLFLVIFAIAAFVINTSQHRSYSAQNIRLQQLSPEIESPQPHQQQQIDTESAAAARKAADDAAAEHSRFVTRYLNPGFSRASGVKTVALVVATDSGQLDPILAGTLADHFRNNSVSVSTSLFKPEFVADNLFASVFGGSTEVLGRLGIAASLDALLLARETAQYSKDASLDKLISVTLQLDIQLVPVADTIQSQSWSFTANGAGFSRIEAKSMAVERIMKQINKDTTMSLGL